MKSKKLTRFELFCNGDAQRIGFIQGLEETNIPSDTQATLVYKFDKELKIPPLDIFKTKAKDGYYIASYFTEEGLSKFRNEIQSIINAINDDGIFTVGRIVTHKDESSVIYEDEYQVIQMSLDLTDISSAVAIDCKEEGLYKIVHTTGEILPVELRKLEKCIENKIDIIVNPFYLEGSFEYHINLENNTLYLI